MNWTQFPIATIDTETTGTDATDRVVEVAAVVIYNGKPSAKWERRVNPGIPIPPEASEIHKITDEKVDGLLSIAFVWHELLSLTRDAYVAAYNAPFDKAILDNEAKRYNRDPIGARNEVWLDPLVWAREVDKYEKGKRLVDVAKRRNIPIDGAHGALSDALMSARVMWALRNQVPSELNELLEWQETCRKKQEAEYAAWRAKQAQKGQSA